MAEVWLRRTRGYRVTILVQMGWTLGLVVFVAGFYREDRAAAVLVAAVFWLVILVPAFLLTLRPRYRIQDDVFTVHGLLRRRSYRLADIASTSMRGMRRTRGPTWLALTIDRKVRITLADSLWCRCYYRPEDLRALADGLAKSAHPRPRQDAGWLRWFADDPCSERWP